jgi:prolyl-tRNA editing enzyme YbaK/EbsC (Cys-tRNA(Pro) deacylase)
MTALANSDAVPAPVAAVIGRLGFAARFHSHPRWQTTEELRPYLESHGFDAQAMLKTLAFKTPAGLGLVTLRMLDKVDYGAVARALGVSRAALGLLAGDELLQRLHMEPGAVCPFAEGEGIRLLLDERALARELIYCGSGVLSCTVEIASAALRAIAGAQAGTFAKPA